MNLLLDTSSTLKSVMFMLMPVAGCALLAIGIFQVVMDSRRGEHKRLIDRLKGETTSTRKVKVDSLLKKSLIRGENLDVLSAALNKLSFIPKLQTLLDQANVDWSAPRLVLNLCAGAAGLFAVLLVLKFSIITAVGCGAAVIILPLVSLQFMRKRRMKKLTYQLPDVFEMMSQALRAGHSLASSFQLIYEQLPDPIGTEFGRVFHEQNLGLKIEDALLAMADRVDSLDLRFFVTAVLIQRQTGGDLAEVLDNIGSVIRQRIELFGMVSALTAEGRLSGWVLFALPAVVFVATLFLNPEYAGVLLNTSAGKLMLVVAGGMQLMGIAMIRWIVNIKV